MASDSSRPDDREARLTRLRQLTRTPVLIIGGGINGISTFRELALQGIPVVMVEKGDWCQAASGALSRMIHGGLRYLETGEFSLVKESVQERDRLLKNAPHFVAPLRTEFEMRLTTFAEEARRRGMVPSTQVIDSDTLPAGRTVADALDIDPDDTVHYIERLPDRHAGDAELLGEDSF